MRVFLKRTFACLLCIALLSGSNAVQTFCTEAENVVSYETSEELMAASETDEDTLAEEIEASEEVENLEEGETADDEEGLEGEELSEEEYTYEYSYDEIQLLGGADNPTRYTFSYEVNADGTTCTITGFDGLTVGNLIIPEKIDGYTVTGIKSNMIIDPDLSFTGGELYIPASVTSIGTDAFRYQPFDEIYVGCSINNIGLDTSSSYHKVKNIGNESINLFELDYHVWNNASTGERNVTSLGPGETAFIDDYEELEYKYEVISESEKTVRLTGYTGLIPTYLKLPEKIDGYTVTALGENLFVNTDNQVSEYLENVIIPGTVTEISENTFANCNALTRVINRSSVSFKLPEIQDHTFNLDSAPDDAVTTVPAGETAFRDDEYKLKYEDNGDGTLSIIGVVADSEGMVKGYLNIPRQVNGKTVTRIATHAFHNQHLLVGDIIIPDTVTKIEEYGFAWSWGFDGELYVHKNLECGSAAFSSMYSIGKITIEEGTTTIYDYEFSGMSRVRELHIPESVTEIRESSFFGLSLNDELVIPKNVKNIGEFAFMRVRAPSIKFEGPVETIDCRAFSECNNLKEIEFPEGMTKVGYNVLGSCKNLEKIVIPRTFESVIPRKDFGDTYLWDSSPKLKDVINNGTEEIGWEGEALVEEQSGAPATAEGNRLYPGGRAYGKAYGNRFKYTVVSEEQRTAYITGYNREAEGDLEIPIYVDGYVVIGIGSKAFAGCDSFEGDLYIPEYVKDVAADAFEGCTGIKRVVNNGTAIVTLPQTAGHTWSDENQGTKQLKTIMPGHKAVREDYDGFKLTYEVVSESEKTIRITGYEPEKNSIGWEEWVDNYEIPEKIDGYTVKEIGANAFAGTVMQGFLLIPQTVSTVSNDAFNGCENINRIRNRSSASVNLPQNGHTWKDTTDGHGRNFETTELASKRMAWRDDINYNNPVCFAPYCCGYQIISEEDNTARLLNIPHRNDVVNGFELTLSPYIPQTVDGYRVIEIGTGCMDRCWALAGCLAIPEGVEIIKQSAFLKTKITAVYFPSTLRSIAISAFEESCIEHLIIPEGVECISFNAFESCPLKSVKLPESLRYCGGTFCGDSDHGTWKYNCDVSFPSNCLVYWNGDYAPDDYEEYSPFKDVVNGKYVFPEGIEAVPSQLLDVNGLRDRVTEIVIPDSVRILSIWAFNYSLKIKRITIPEGVTTIDDMAFAYMENLTRIDFPASVRSFGYTVTNCALKSATFRGPVSECTKMDYFDISNTILGNEVGSITNLYSEPLDLSFVFGRILTSLEYTDFETGEVVDRFVQPGHTVITQYYTGEDFTYEIVSAEEKTVRITGYSGDEEDINDIYIPEYILHYKVVDIAEDAFDDQNLKGKLAKFENASDAALTLPAVEGKVWVDEETGLTIQKISEGQEAELIPVNEDVQKKMGITYKNLEEGGYTYTGSAIKPEIAVYDGETELNSKTDYTIAYKNNTKVYTLKEGDEGFNAKLAPSITITSKGNYTGKKTLYFTINPKNVADGDINVDIPQMFESTKALKITPTVTYGKVKLANNKDYTIAYYTDSTCTEGATPMAAGTYYAKITGNGGNYTGEKVVEFTVYSSNIKAVSKLSVTTVKTVSYTGDAIEPEITVKDGKTVLVVGKKGVTSPSDCDVYVLYEDNTEVGTATVKIKGSGVKYAGNKSVTFKITGTAISKAKVSGLTAACTYDGTEKKQPGAVLTYSPSKGVTNTLNWIDKSDYDALEAAAKKNYDAYVTYEKNASVGTATMVFTGVNGYTGTYKTKFKINAYDMTSDPDNKLDVSIGSSYAYSKAGVKPEPKVTFGGKTLVNGKDYKLSYTANTTVSSASKKVPTVKITGTGNFKGNVSVNFTIKPKSFTSAAVSMTAPDKVWSNKAGNWKSTLTVTDDGKKLSAGKDYGKNVVYTYYSIPADGVVYDGASKEKVKPAITRVKGERVGDKDIVPAGTIIRAEVEAAGDSYLDSRSTIYRIIPKNIADGKIKVSVDAQVYTGKAIKIKKGDISFSGKDIGTVTYEIDKNSYKNNVNKGKASVVINGTGNYGGSRTITFDIKQKVFKWWWED